MRKTTDMIEWRPGSSVPKAWAALDAELIRRNLSEGGDLTQEHLGECWQLMCFVPDPDGTEWVEFRHRRHPRTRTREYVRVEVK